MKVYQLLDKLNKLIREGKATYDSNVELYVTCPLYTRELTNFTATAEDVEEGNDGAVSIYAPLSD